LPRLRAIVARRLAQKWSPQQISGWLERTVTIDDSNGKPHIEVAVAGHADEETTVVDRAINIDTPI
jgi:hypothetical protein